MIDLADPHHPNYTILSGRDVLTYYCLEQFRNVSRTGPYRVMHVEPAAELLSFRRPADWANLIYVRSQHYQTSLIGNFQHMRDERMIELMRTERVTFAAFCHNGALEAGLAKCGRGVNVDERIR